MAGLLTSMLGAGSAGALTISWTVADDQGGLLGDGTLSGAMISCDDSGPFSCGDTSGQSGPLWSDGTADYTVMLNGVSGDPDPVVTIGFGFTNTSGITQSYMFSTTLPIAPPLGPPVPIAGSAGAVIFPDPYSLGCSSSGILPCTTTDSGAFGPTPVGVAATSSIGIVYRFTLSPGDSIGVSGSFAVVPEPGEAVLTLIGLLLLVGQGRRRA